MLYLQRPDQFHQCSQHKYELQGPCFWAMLILSTRFEALACFSWLFVLVELTLRSIAALCCFLLQAVHFFFEPSIYSIFAVMFNTQIFRVDPWLWTQRNSSLCLGKAFVAFFSSFFFLTSSLWGKKAYFIVHTFVHILSGSLCSSALKSHCSTDGWHVTLAMCVCIVLY